MQAENRGERKKKRVGEREKIDSGRERKRDSGRETVTNLTYITIQISSKYHKIEIGRYVYRGVKSEEKKASPDTYSVM